MAGTLASTAIITRGLTCGQVGACDFGAMITTPWDLFCRIRRAVVDSGGGPYPFPAWNRFEPGEIHKFFKPIDAIDELNDLFKPLKKNATSQPFYIVPYDQLQHYLNASGERHFMVSIEVGGKQTMKTFSVPVSPDAKAKIENLSSKKVKPQIGEITGRKPRVKGLRGKAPWINKIRDKYSDE